MMQKKFLGTAVAAAISLTLLTACGDDETSNNNTATPAPSAPAATAADIVINEVNSNAGTYDYIELYNKSSAAYTFAAGEWGIRDNSATTAKNTLAIPGGTVIKAKSFLLVLPDNTTLPAGAASSSILAPSTGDAKDKFGLGAADSAILLYKGAEHERHDWTAHVKTDGRFPDGTGTWQAAAGGFTPGDANEPTPTKLTLDFLGRYSTFDSFAQGAAEIPAYDAINKRGFVVNAKAGTVDVLSFDTTTGQPIKSATINLSGVALAGTDLEVNSVAVKNGLVALAVQNKIKTENGYVAIYDANTLARLASAELKDGSKNGAQPDNVTFSPDGKTVLLALEGEPSDDYQTDPEGGIAVVDVSGLPTSTAISVKIADFKAWNVGGTKTLPADVRIYGQKTSGGVVTKSSVAQDIEPEYIAVSADSKTAWITLQENNALAILDIATASVTDIKALGFKDYGLADSGFTNAHASSGNSGNGIDSADEGETIAGNVGGKAINIVTKSGVLGMYLPDTLSAYDIDGDTYLVSANEGDSRAWGEDDAAYWGTQTIANGSSATTHCTGGDASKGFVEEFRVKHLTDSRGYNRRCGDDLPPQLAAMAGGAFLNPSNFGWCGATDDGTSNHSNPRGTCGNDDVLGRLNISWTMGYQKWADGTAKLFNRETGAALPQGTAVAANTWLKYDNLYSYGARSFSIRDASGALVWDSGDAIEKFLASDECKLKADRSLSCKTWFNIGHDEGGAFDSRSDAKGPEPEGLAIGKIGNKTFAFVGLERMGGVLIYDITDPTAPKFHDYLNTRENYELDPETAFASGTAQAESIGDLGPEGLVFIPASKSPTGKALIVVGNEVSGSTAVLEIKQDFSAP
ncbi:MAG: choice-of-anchor I domain-containing protein [Moraxellaceae bacterium]